MRPCVCRPAVVVLLILGFLVVGMSVRGQGIEMEMGEVVPLAGPTLPAGALAQPEDRLVFLRAGPLDPAAVGPAQRGTQVSDALRWQGLTAADVGYYVLHLAPGAATAEARARIAGAGGRVVGSVPHNAFVVKGPGRALLALGNQPPFDLAVAFHPADRIEPGLAEDLARGPADTAYTVNVSLFPEEDEGRILAAFHELGARVMAYTADRGLGATCRLRGSPAAVLWVASLPGVQWIERWLPYRLHNDVATGTAGPATDLLGLGDLWTTHGLDGSGMVVGHADTGLDLGVHTTALHRDFLDESGAATRAVRTRGWGLRSDHPRWLDTTAASQFGAYTFGPVFHAARCHSDRGGVVRAVTLYLERLPSPIPEGTLRVRFWRGEALPAPDVLLSASSPESSTRVQAEELSQAGFSGYTFFFDDPGVTVAADEWWWVVVDLSGVSQRAAVRVGLGSVSGQAVFTGSPGGSWVTLPDWALLCEVYDELRWDDPNGHGTHTLGSILGNGQTYQGRYRGPAYQASFVHQSVLASDGLLAGIPNHLGTLFEEAYGLGARIHSNSWGTSARGNYTLDARAVDQFAWLHPEFLPLFSAGNDGSDGRWLVPPSPVTEVALASTAEWHCFKFEHPGGYLRGVILNLRRSADAGGILTGYIDSDDGSGRPKRIFPPPDGLGSVAVAALPHVTGTTADYRPVEFGQASHNYSAGTYWVYLRWSSRAGSVSVACANSGSGNYAVDSGSDWSLSSNLQAVSVRGGDGVIDLGSISSPATAKNCLAIGASETVRVPNAAGFTAAYSTELFSAPVGGDSVFNNASGIAATSSRGPTLDGRIKPDLVAPGTFIASPRTQKLAPLVWDDAETVFPHVTRDAQWYRDKAVPYGGSYRYRGEGGEGLHYLTYNADIDLTTLPPGSVELWFYAKWKYAGTQSSVQLEFSNNGDGAYQPGSGSYFWRKNSGTEDSALSWTLQKVPIPASYMTQRFRFRFRINTRGTGQAYCYLDDILLWQPNGAAARLNSLKAAGWEHGDARHAYVFMNGTSMACPLAAGAATLAREYFVEKKGIAHPSAALIKAALINEATDLSPGQYSGEVGARPDPSQGWGRVNAKRALFRSGARVGGFVMADDRSPQRFTGAGQTRVLKVFVPPIAENTTEPVRVTLAWTDRPAAPYAGRCLVNDLDLTVEHFDSLDGNTPPPDAGGSPNVTWPGNRVDGGDHRNNVEGVDVGAPVQPGWYRVTVTCYSLPEGGEQPWALVLSGGFVGSPPPTPGVVEHLHAAIAGTGGPLIEWSPAAGLGTVGYHVARAESPRGPFARVSDGLILSAPRCRFHDTRAAAGRTYFYRVEAVGPAGETMESETVTASPDTDGRASDS